MPTKIRAAALLAAAAVSLAGCASAANSRHTPAADQMMMSPGMVMPDGSSMTPGSPGTGPSDAAKMICADETRDNITTVLSTAPDPHPRSSWTGGTYTCTYRLPMGAIVLSVHESADAAAAESYTVAQRRTMPGAKDLTGLTRTAFGTTDGVVVLRKDNDTLRVDTSALRQQSDKLYAHRATFAYEIAAVIMGCWTGG